MMASRIRKGCSKVLLQWGVFIIRCGFVLISCSFQGVQHFGEGCQRDHARLFADRTGLSDRAGQSVQGIGGQSVADKTPTETFGLAVAADQADRNQAIVCQ